MTEMNNEFGGRERRRAERFCLDDDEDFYVDADIVGAETVDVSQTGIAFRSPEPLRVEMRINIDGEREERTAKLVRAEQNPDGSVVYGLEFIDEQDISDGEIV